MCGVKVLKNGTWSSPSKLGSVSDQRRHAEARAATARTAWCAPRCPCACGTGPSGSRRRSRARRSRASSPSTIQIVRFVRSAHSSTEITSASRISRPPMVGVPALLWWSGPISRIGWPTRSAWSLRMTAGPRDEREEQRGERRRGGAERDVPEHVQRAEALGAAAPAGGRASATLHRSGEGLDDALHAASSASPSRAPSRPLQQLAHARTRSPRASRGDVHALASPCPRRDRGLGQRGAPKRPSVKRCVEPERRHERAGRAVRPRARRRRARPCRRAPRCRASGAFSCARLSSAACIDCGFAL